MSTNIFHDTSCVMENVSSVSSVMENVSSVSSVMENVSRH